jgi:hypothetical protein
LIPKRTKESKLPIDLLVAKVDLAHRKAFRAFEVLDQLSAKTLLNPLDFQRFTRNKSWTARVFRDEDDFGRTRFFAG